MNKVILMGRLTRDPEIRYANNENNTCIANYTLAVDRRFKRQEMNRLQTLSTVLYLAEEQSLQKIICIRELRS